MACTLIFAVGWIGGDGGEDWAVCTEEWGPTSILDAIIAARANDGIGGPQFANVSGEALRRPGVSSLVAHPGL